MLKGCNENLIEDTSKRDHVEHVLLGNHETTVWAIVPSFVVNKLIFLQLRKATISSL